jgi:hypothetical protein
VTQEDDFTKERLQAGDSPIAVVRLLRDKGLSLGLAKEVVDRNLSPEMREATEAIRDSAWEALSAEPEATDK